MIGSLWIVPSLCASNPAFSPLRVSAPYFGNFSFAQQAQRERRAMALALLVALPVGAIPRGLESLRGVLGGSGGGTLGGLDEKEMDQYDKREDGSIGRGSVPGIGSRRSDGGNFGVVWAVTGDSTFWREVSRSAFSLKIHKQNATVFTTMNELGACGRASDAEKEASWSCKVASVAAGVVLEKAEKESKAMEKLAVTTDGEAPKRNSLAVAASVQAACRRLLLFWHDLEQGGNGTAARCISE